MAAAARLPSAMAAITLLGSQLRRSFMPERSSGDLRLELELPAGTLEDGEDPAACAAREIREEIGMAAGTLTPLGEFFLAPGYCFYNAYRPQALCLYLFG